MSKPAAPASSHNSGRSPKPKRFRNLEVAGAMLAERLGKREQNSIVLAIVRGGTPVGREVAVQRGLPFDIVLIRRLVGPDGPGSDLCGVSVAGTLVLDEGI